MWWELKISKKVKNKFKKEGQEVFPDLDVMLSSILATKPLVLVK